jgi:EAL domain-containing protein (putative c-di-GMP-specific phosphodiesterase class I)
MTGAQGWPEAWRLSLNVTPEDFALPDFAGSLLGRARDAGFAPERLTIEITEQTLIADFAACAQALRQLAGQGVRVALDDFGTGFSNFRTLKALPLDTLKIDRSLVRDVAHDRRDRAILAAMVAMARALAQRGGRRRGDRSATGGSGRRGRRPVPGLFARGAVGGYGHGRAGWLTFAIKLWFA